jgi:hypothetical protein
VTDDLPERFRSDDAVVTPWGGDEVLVQNRASRS